MSSFRSKRSYVMRLETLLRDEMEKRKNLEHEIKQMREFSNQIISDMA